MILMPQFLLLRLRKVPNLGSNGITNHSNIGSLIVNERVKYNGNGSDRITQALEVAKDKTLTIGNSGTSLLNLLMEPLIMQEPLQVIFQM